MLTEVKNEHMKNSFYALFLIIGIIGISCSAPETKTITQKDPHLKALIIDGENNHGIWPKTTIMMKDYLEKTGMFTVDISRKKYTWQGPHHNVEVDNDRPIESLLSAYPITSSNDHNAVAEPVIDSLYFPDFEKYDVVINNLGWKATHWPQKTKDAFVKYMKEGGGLVIIHAANNSFGDWQEYNEIIGLGGWGGRNTESGPYVYIDDEGHRHDDHSEGACGSHGPQSEFVITNRAPDHPIMKGVPTQWLHAKDELYDRLRGPAQNLTVLATAYSDKEGNSPPWNPEMPGTERHEPMLMTIDYGKGRVFHNTLGHMDYSMECVGFITTFLRGCEWAATGEVTTSVPADFPNESEVRVRRWTL